MKKKRKLIFMVQWIVFFIKKKKSKFDLIVFEFSRFCFYPSPPHAIVLRHFYFIACNVKSMWTPVCKFVHLKKMHVNTDYNKLEFIFIKYTFIHIFLNIAKYKSSK